MKGLRLDYFLNLGLKLVDSDALAEDHRAGVVVGEDISASCVNNARSSNRIIESLSQRENKGVIPCDGDIPVIVNMKNSNRYGNAVTWLWSVSDGIESWKPDIEKLIEMQAEHEKQSNKYECITNPQEIARLMSE